MQTTIHPEAAELAALLEPAWPEMQARLDASGVPVMLVKSAGESLMPKVRDLNQQIASGKADAAEAWTKFDTARSELAESDAASDPESPQFVAAQDLSRAYDEKATAIAELERTRDGLLAMMTADGPESVNGPEDVTGNGDRAGSFGATGSRDVRANIGQIALNSEAYRQWTAENAFTANGRKSVEGTLVGTNGERGRDALAHALRSGRGMASLVTGSDDNSAGALVQPQTLPGITVPLRHGPLRMTDLITIGQTDSDTVEYVEMTGFLNNAAETAEASATDGTSGTKPESGLDLKQETEKVKNIAHWIPATKRALADAGQMRTLIEQVLRLGLDMRLDQQIASGNGQGENLRGIYNTVGIGQAVQVKAASGNTSTPEIILDTIHRAITIVRLAWFQPTAVGIHPNDWEKVRLVRAGKAAVANTADAAGSYAEGDYIMGHPTQGGFSTIWGLAPVVSAAFKEGHPVVGDFSMATLWLREGTKVLASDSHNDFFIRNMVAILAEFRAAFGVLAPAAFCEANIS